MTTEYFSKKTSDIASSLGEPTISEFFSVRYSSVHAQTLLKHKTTVIRYDVVYNLMIPYFNLCHHVYFDNYFTSIVLMDELERRETWACGTFRKNRVGIPEAVKTHGRLAQGMLTGRDYLLYRNMLRCR